MNAVFRPTEWYLRTKEVDRSIVCAGSSLAPDGDDFWRERHDADGNVDAGRSDARDIDVIDT